MNTHSAASAYKEAIFENAPPIKVVHMMYEGALRFLATAEALDPRERIQEYSQTLNRAEAIVVELRLALDHEHAPELAAQLDSLYRFAEDQIREAFLEQSKEPIAGAAKVLQTLLEAWRQVEINLPTKVT